MATTKKTKKTKSPKAKKAKPKKADITKVKDLVDCDTTAERLGCILQTIEKLYKDDYNIEKRLNERIDKIVFAIDHSKSTKGL